MVQLSVSATVPVPVDRAWTLVSDLSLFGDWLALHDGWRSELPRELSAGVEITSVVKAKGIRNRISWTITDYDPPGRIVLSGEGVGGTAVSLAFSLKPDGDGTAVALDVDFKHPMLKGPMGAVAGRTIKGDVQSSMKRLVSLAEARG